MNERPVLNVTVWKGPGGSIPAVLVHGTFSWATLAFEHQRPLARGRTLLLPDRRGFGASPDLNGGGERDVTSDYAIDAVDISELLGDGAHLVGHSYGGTVAMLAAAAHPDRVVSLTLIEPCAHTTAADEPVVARAIEDGRRFMAGARLGTPGEYIDLAYGGRPRPEPAAWLLRAAHTALHERPCWLAELATEPVRDAPYPKLVITGDWATAPDGYLPGMATLMQTICTRVADRIGARLVRVPGAAHEPQRERPAAFNDLLTEFWSAT